MKILLSLTLIPFTLLSFLFFTPPIFAQDAPCSGDQCVINIGDRQKSGGIPGIPAIGNPNASPGTIVSNAVRILFIVGGLAVLVFMIWGAFDWITSGGDKEAVASARKKITNSLIGLALLALSAFIVSLVGQIVGFNPLLTPPLPSLGDTPATTIQAPAAP